MVIFMIHGTPGRRFPCTTGRRGDGLKISELTFSEADYLQAVCNFTREENELFELRLQGLSLDECAERMHRSLDSVKQLSRRVNKKISKEY